MTPTLRYFIGLFVLLLQFIPTFAYTNNTPGFSEYGTLIIGELSWYKEIPTYHFKYFDMIFFLNIYFGKFLNLLLICGLLCLRPCTLSNWVFIDVELGSICFHISRKVWTNRNSRFWKISLLHCRFCCFTDNSIIGVCGKYQPVHLVWIHTD